MRYIEIILISILLISCNSKKEEREKSLNGFWEQVGYGNIIELKDSTIRVYNLCQVDCHLSFEENILDFGRIKEVAQDTLIIKHNIDDWKFYRINELPELCLNTTRINKNDPIHNFETFWHTFNENYASFKLKNVDWNEVYKNYRGRVTTKTSGVELFSIIKEMTDLLDDGHIGIDAPSEIENEYQQKQIKKRKRYSNLDLFEINKEIANLYVDSLNNYNGGFVRWGMIKNEVGYIQFNSMWMIANFDIDPDLDLMKTHELFAKNAEKLRDEELRDEEENGADFIMNKIMKDLENANSFILDLRFNGGGKDNVAMQIMNRFTDKKKRVASKYVKFKDSFAAHQNIFVAPSALNFNGKLTILTSHLTASAAELAVLASMPNSNIERIGSNTEGIFSSTLDKSLPNGWTYELSNEIYVDLEGNNYEGRGIPPDISIDYPVDKDEFIDKLKYGITKQKDEIIEIALKQLVPEE